MRIFLPPKFLNQKGSLLVTVLAFLVILSLLALTAGWTVRQRLNAVTRLETRAKLRLAAEAGIKWAALTVREAGKQNLHALSQEWANSDKFKAVKLGQAQFSLIGSEDSEKEVYGLMDENRKINLNTADPKILQELLEITCVLPPENARRITAAISDWKDEDEDLHDGGAESRDYLEQKPPYRAKNAPFSMLEELQWVKGVTPKIYNEIRPFLTLDAAQVNINTAGREVMIAMGVQPATVTKIINYRAGKDKTEGTPDDRFFSSVQEVAEKVSTAALMNEDEKNLLYKTLSRGFDVRSTFWTALAEASIPGRKQKMRVHAVLGADGETQRWFEEFI